MNYQAQKSVSLIENGDYEAVISEMKLRPSKNNTESLSITYRIRDDVEQEFKNRKVFENIWLGSDFHQKRISNLLYAVKAPKDQSFNGINEVINYCVGKPLLINVEKKFSEYFNEEVNSIKYVKQTALVNKTLDKNEDSLELSDDELPF